MGSLKYFKYEGIYRGKLEKEIFLMQNEQVLQENYEFFLTKKRELLNDVNRKDKFVVVYEKELKGFFKKFDEAYIWAKNEFTDENFIIQQIVDETEITHFIYELQCR